MTAYRRCLFAGCWLEEHETGDHQLGRPPAPRGRLRCSQEFRVVGSAPSCDLHEDSPQRALGFYVDELGFGWQLCYGCVQRHGGVVVLPSTMIVCSTGELDVPRSPSPDPPSPRSAKILSFSEHERGIR